MYGSSIAVRTNDVIARGGIQLWTGRQGLSEEARYGQTGQPLPFTLRDHMPAWHHSVSAEGVSRTQHRAQKAGRVEELR